MIDLVSAERVKSGTVSARREAGNGKRKGVIPSLPGPPQISKSRGRAGEKPGGRPDRPSSPPFGTLPKKEPLAAREPAATRNLVEYGKAEHRLEQTETGEPIEDEKEENQQGLGKKKGNHC